MRSALAMLGSKAQRGPSGDGRVSSSGEERRGAESLIDSHVARLKVAEEARKAREARLSGINPAYIDVTMVECLSTGHETLDDQLNAFKLLTDKCGIKDIVLAAFVKERSPDLSFLEVLRGQKLIDAHCFAFTELFDANGSDLPGQDLPFGLANMIKFGIQNAILECDLAAPYINWDKYDINDFCALVESRCRWVAANLHAGRSQPPASYINLRDFASAMQSAPARVLALVEFLARLEPSVRPRGIFVNEPAGVLLPLDAGPGVAAVRGVMEAAGWADGLLLVHVAAGHGLAHATVLECLAAGCDGVVASLCEEASPAPAPASSLLDLINLAALGNQHVAARYDMHQLRVAAHRVAACMGRAAAAAAAKAAGSPGSDGRGSSGGGGGGGGGGPRAHLTPVQPLTSSAHASGAAAMAPPHQRQPLIHGHA